LTTSLEGSGFFNFGCTFLGKGEENVHDVEGKEDDRIGWVSQGDNECAVKVAGRGEVE
ncbi:hypothetical protein KI387_032049, partial [Taxus chinensis]